LVVANLYEIVILSDNYWLSLTYEIVTLSDIYWLLLPTGLLTVSMQAFPST